MFYNDERVFFEHGQNIDMIREAQDAYKMDDDYCDDLFYEEEYYEEIYED